MQRTAMLIFFAIVTQFSNAESWKPEVSFQLEETTHKEALIWVSGVSYALSAGNPGSLCGFPESIGSKQLLGYLNGTHSGNTISAEQAIETIFTALKKDYPC